jgi:murein DD-endopeptidase MepM/ murein hydrolase activator NlpD
LAVAFAPLFTAVAGADDTTTTGPPATDSTTTTTPPDDTTTTTAPGDTTTTTAPVDTTTTTGPADDPAQGADGASEPVPDDPYSKGLYANQESLQQALAVRGTLKVVQATALRAKAAHDAALADILRLTQTLGTLTDAVAHLRVAQRDALTELVASQQELQRRAANAYVRGSLTGAETALSSSDANEYFNKVVLMDSVLASDQQVIDRFKVAKARVNGDLLTMSDEVMQTQRELSAAKAREADTAQQAESAAFDLDVFSKGGTIAIHGFRFPVDNPHDFVDSFGAPRLVGTPNQHWHEGVDIMAPRNTQLFACEAGTVIKVGTNSLGGLSLWIKGQSGTSYYYAHLDHFADGVVPGLQVTAGQLVGFVGNTGDAAGGPTHLHFEVHPGGGKAVDPYPLLVVVDKLQAQQAANG